MITIELLFASKTCVWQQNIQLPAQSTAQQALEQSRLYQEHPEAVGLSFGIFGELCQAETILLDGDRLEVYRPLVFDPMESRRRRATHRAEQQQQTRKRRKPSVAASMIVNRN